MASNLDVSAIDVTADMIDETEDVFAPLAAAFSHIHDSAIVYSADTLKLFARALSGQTVAPRPRRVRIS